MSFSTATPSSAFVFSTGSSARKPAGSSKGDANDFVDDARPRAKEVSGSLWFSIPHAGSALVWLREPLHAALLAFVLTIVALTGGGGAQGRSEYGHCDR